MAIFDRIAFSEQHPNARAFFDELHRLGYVRGDNLLVKRHDAGGRDDRMAEVARDVVDWKPDLIVASGTGPNLAIKAATTSIPILMAVSDPVALGLVASLARPGGNITGISFLVSGEWEGKMLQLLHEALPGARRVAVFVNDNAVLLTLPNTMRPAAQRLEIELITFHMRMPSDAEAMISDAQQQRADAIWAYGGGDLGGAQFARLVSAAGLPLMSVVRLQTEAGGLLSYGPDYPDLYRRAAGMADRLLKGARPAEMPVEQPTKFELVINLKTAQKLGVTIPRSLLLRADEVIQ